MRQVSAAIIIVLILVLVGCVSAPTKFMYRPKENPDKVIHYLSKDVPTFVMAISGISWGVTSVEYNHTLLTSTTGPQKIINIFEYSDG